MGVVEGGRTHKQMRNARSESGRLTWCTTCAEICMICDGGGGVGKVRMGHGTGKFRSPLSAIMEQCPLRTIMVMS